MIHINARLQNTLNELKSLILQLPDDVYALKNDLLLGASIGQHTRHIIEIFEEIEIGYPNSIVHYDKRKRDYLLETDQHAAIEKMELLLIALQKPDKPMMHYQCLDTSTDQSTSFESSFLRELLYGIEHAVHHMAIIRIGLQKTPNIVMPENFGIAVSTIRYKQSCVQ